MSLEYMRDVHIVKYNSTKYQWDSARVIIPALSNYNDRKMTQKCR